MPLADDAADPSIQHLFCHLSVLAFAIVSDNSIETNKTRKANRVTDIVFMYIVILVKEMIDRKYILLSDIQRSA